MIESTAEKVPDWCDFFGLDEYEAFCAEVDDACLCFGADGQDLSAGSVELAAGEPVDIYAFPLARLAARCHDAPREKWGSRCFRQICDWIENTAQSAWLEQAPFEQVRDGLRVHLNTGDARYQGTNPDDPREYFRVPLADGLCLGLVMDEVPAPHDDEPEIDTQVHNAAVAAWGMEPDRLVDAALANLRRQEPPEWTAVPVHVRDDAGQPVATATLREGAGPFAAGWALLLDEIESAVAAHGAVVAVPSQDTLIVCPVPEPAVWDRLAAAVAEMTRERFAEAFSTWLSDGVYRYHQRGFSRMPVRS